VLIVSVCVRFSRKFVRVAAGTATCVRFRGRETTSCSQPPSELRYEHVFGRKVGNWSSRILSKSQRTECG
jgi:hypothetical protein